MVLSRFIISRKNDFGGALALRFFEFRKYFEEWLF
jgi:hypothetical protein